MSESNPPAPAEPGATARNPQAAGDVRGVVGTGRADHQLFVVKAERLLLKLEQWVCGKPRRRNAWHVDGGARSGGDEGAKNQQSCDGSLHGLQRARNSSATAAALSAASWP